MNPSSQFRYPLAPVLLTKEWDLDALKRELVSLNDSMETLRSEEKNLQEQADIVARDWNSQAGASQLIEPQRLTAVLQYIDGLSKQCRQKQTALEEMAAERNVLIDRMTLAQRGIEAFEQHRDQMHAQFIKLGVSAEIKSADDHWNTLQVRTGSYE